MKLTMHSEGHLQAMLGPAGKPGGNRTYHSAHQGCAYSYQDLHRDRPSGKESPGRKRRPPAGPAWPPGPARSPGSHYPGPIVP
jgi:anaerobic selenocysteine-containing dehydrogenase